MAGGFRGYNVSVVSKDFLRGFQHTAIQTLVNPLQAANGTSVIVDSFCEVLLEIQVIDGKREKKTPRPAVLPVDVVVGYTACRILSVCKLGKQGWDFSCGKAMNMTHSSNCNMGTRLEDHWMEKGFSPEEPSSFTVECFCDSNWGGCKTTRRSTSSGMIFLNGNMVLCFCKSQTTVSLSRSYLGRTSSG